MNLVIVGCQNGDEGKGKYSDYFASDDGAVVRYQGGPHTGHGVIAENQSYKFVQVPAGAARGAACFIGNGCVVDPIDLVTEIARHQDATGRPVRLTISPTAHVVFPYHRAMDAAHESWRGSAVAISGDTGLRDWSGQLGSTRRGVGPCREDKVARIGLRMIDLLDADLLADRIPRLLGLKRRVLDAIAPGITVGPPADWDAGYLCERYHQAARVLAPQLGDVPSRLLAMNAHGTPIVFEGAQSLALDIEHGTYPFCSSGYSAAGGVFVGTGLPPTFPVRVFGVMKCYATTVGGGPLPTEIDGEIAGYIRGRGREYGTVTGRARRIGWLDLCLVRRAVRIDGICGLCVSCLDVMAGLDEVKVATHYVIGGTRFDEMPVAMSAVVDATPGYYILPGWPEFDPEEVVESGPRALPKNASIFLDWLSETLSVPIVAIGVGPSRRHTVSTVQN